jgi:serine O-acetyltransferase
MDDRVDDRAYLAQALIGELHAQLAVKVGVVKAGVGKVGLGQPGEGAPFCVLDDAERSGEIAVAVCEQALDRVPQALAGLCRKFDLRLVQLLRREIAGWQAVLAWSDEVGRPRFLSVHIHSDWYRDGVLLLRARELFGGQPDIRFIHTLLNCVSRGAVDDADSRRLGALWQEAPRQALEQIARFWRRPADIRILAHAARQGSWTQVAASLPRLRRAMRRRTPYPLHSALGILRRCLMDALEPARAAIAFVGASRERRESVRQAVARELAPAFPSGASTIAYSPGDEHWGIDVRIVLDDPELAAGHVTRDADVARVDASQPPAAVVAAAGRAILHWLESRVERRFPELLGGRNPPAARLLQRACRTRIPLLSGLIETLLNCDIEVRLPAPVLMPHPYGIVIECGAEIGNRVTIMQQATLAAAHAGAPIIEDNVTIGPGAKVIGRVRIGRYANIGANAVVTRDVPSHCSVVGSDQVIGQPPVVVERRAVAKTVVNS